ncbi:MAG: hypothetical protein ACI8XO_002804 [Verrucomicrobiales bacterium]|jgi:hypothetical protein
MTRDSRKTDYANGFDQCVSSQPTLKIFLGACRTYLIRQQSF